MDKDNEDVVKELKAVNERIEGILTEFQNSREEMNKEKQERELATKRPAELFAVPYKNQSYCRKQGENLIVVLRNIGEVDVEKDVHVKVSFKAYDPDGAPQVEKATTTGLKPKGEISVPFKCPSENCFDPDCEFYIEIDPEKVLKDNRDNYKVRGVCSEKDMKRNLVAAQFPNNSYFELDGNELKVKIENKGSGEAEPTKTVIGFRQDGVKEIVVDTKALEPGEEAIIVIDLTTIIIDGEALNKNKDFSLKIVTDARKNEEKKWEGNHIVYDSYQPEDVPF